MRLESMSTTLSATTSEARSPAPYAVANAALYFGAVATRSSSVTSSTLSTVGIRRGYGTTVRRRARSGRSSVTVKKNRRAETAPLMLGGCTPLRVWCSWKRRTSSAVAVSGDRPMKAANARTCRHIVAARPLIEAVHGHVFDHARPQWADGPLRGIGGHWGSPELKVAGPSMLGIRRPDRHALPPITLVQIAPTATRAPLSRERVRCVPGMLNSSEVKVLYPT